MPASQLHVTLDAELPSEVRVGLGTALFVCGWCFCPDAPIRTLEFVLDGQPPQPVMAAAMPRLDPFRTLHPELDPYVTASLPDDPASNDDPALLSYRSGFWGLVRILGPRPAARVTVWLRARLGTGGDLMAPLAELDLVDLDRPVVEGGHAECRNFDDQAQPSVAICMATYNPPDDLLRRQLASIRAQTHTNWICFISDDCSSPESFSSLAEAVGRDPRFALSRARSRRGFYGNFERALAMVTDDAEFIALADQDDVWHPDKLASLTAAIGAAQLVYSDARVVSRDGELISRHVVEQPRQDHSDLLSLLVANAVTGAASLFRRELVEFALPFPPAQFAHFHDHWLGLIALALGDVRFVDRPLYDYVQHGEASLGHAAANRMVSLRDRLRHKRALRDRVADWRLHYFVDVCRLTQIVAVLQMRCGRLMSSRSAQRWSTFWQPIDRLPRSPGWVRAGGAS